MLRTPLVLVALFAVGCIAPADERPLAPPASTKPHRLIFAGDTILGRSVNTLVERHGLEGPLSGVDRLLAAADLTAVNLECVLANSGQMLDLGRKSRAYLRGRPALVAILDAAGVDVASIANNHAMDYGAEGLAGTMRTLRAFGIAPLGGGVDRSAARRPVYRRLGDTVVALIGVHTSQRQLRAMKRRPGTNWVGLGDRAVERVAEQVETARRRAHVVLLMVHWKSLHSSVPTDRARELARRFVRDAGADAVLGSGSHRLQGIEVVDGRPIIHDAGNLVVDWRDRGGQSWTHRSAFFELTLDARGVSEVVARPLSLAQGRTRLAGDAEGDRTLRQLARLSARLGTTLELGPDRASLRLTPTSAPPRPRRTLAGAPPRSAPLPGNELPPVVEPELPATAIPLGAELAGGIELLGYELPTNVDRRTGIYLSTYWTARHTPTRCWEISLDVEPAPRGEQREPETRRRAWRREAHQPGDWMYPTRWWQPHQIVRDQFHIIPGKNRAPGSYDVFVSLTSGEAPPDSASATEPCVSRRVYLGRVEVE
jgi:poly-gamma-glutamate capsule biosynthesis protein CapA/YwtB (metallophosphatase superfamily)